MKMTRPSLFDNIGRTLTEKLDGVMRLRLKLTLPRLSTQSMFALAGIAGPIVLGMADLTAGLRDPGYNPLRDSISSLALLPLGWIQTIGFLIIGLLIIVFAAGLYFGIRKRRGLETSVAIFALFGFGLLLLGAFRTDPEGAPPTIHSTIHLTTATVIFLLFPVACFLMAPSLRADTRWRTLFVYTIVTAALASVLIVIKPLLLPPRLTWFGLYERILVANSIIWLEVMALRLLHLSLHQTTKRRQRWGF